MDVREYLEDGYTVRVSEEAVMQMILSGLEAYSVLHEGKKKRQKRIETAGLLWGNEIQKEKKVLYNITTVSIDTSAKRAAGSVTQNENALKIKKDIMDSFFPQHDFLGDFHTHPYHDYAKVTKKSYAFSKDDINDIETNSEYWDEYNYRVGLVLTIARMTNRKKHPENKVISNNTLQFTTGNYRMWLKAYVIYKKDDSLKFTKHEDDNVILLVPSIEGLVYDNAKFGKVSLEGEYKH